MIKDVSYWGRVQKLAERLYVASYPPEADIANIPPFRSTRGWGRDMWIRVADAALLELEPEMPRSQGNADIPSMPPHWQGRYRAP